MRFAKLSSAILLLTITLSFGAPVRGQEGAAGGKPIRNPYYPKTAWRVWRDDPTPIAGVGTLVRDGKEKKPSTLTLTPTPVAKRIYPTGPVRDGVPIKWATLATPSTKYSGVWDDVYASWSGLHGYMRSSWNNKDGSAVHLRPKGLDHIMHFVELKKGEEIQRCGINFVHQSTTGMAHTITNMYSKEMTISYEKIYFSDCLVTSPAHASFTEEWADRTKDLYLALVPTLFNSVGSSNSETMAITKMMIVGGYLPPETKLTLKRNGLYPAALLYLWKAALPYDVPYDHELRHRIAYRALGHEGQFPGKYGHAGPERGNLALEFHRYDEIAHLRNMIRMAESMDVLPPEAILGDMTFKGGKGLYNLKKAALILQEPGQDVSVKVSTSECYDLQSLPLTVRFKLLYGNKGTTCEPTDEPGTWIINIPWDETLPEGRTAIALIANNGVHDSNPAIINVFRKRTELPPPGAGPGGYNYNSPHANRRPVILNLQDQVVSPGESVSIPLAAVDPEGQPVRFYNRAGEPGELNGNLFTMKVPGDAAGNPVAVTFIASDGTAGNSYAARRVNFDVAPKVHAHIECAKLIGAAPFTVEVSSKGSRATGKLEFGWEFTAPTPKSKPGDWKKMAHGSTAKHTFTKPGLYEVALTAKSGNDTDRQTIHVWVTAGTPPAPVGGLAIEGNGVRIAHEDSTPSAFDHTLFGKADKRERITRTFLVTNRSGEEIRCSARLVTNAGEFKIVRKPRQRISALGSATFDIEFRPRGAGLRTAEVTVQAGEERVKFTIGGTSDIDQKNVDAGADGPFAAAKKLFDDREWAKAEQALTAFIEKYAGASTVAEARALLERIRTDPEIQKEFEAAANAEAAARDLAKQEKKAKSLFKMAESALSSGRKDMARKYLNQVVDKYPETTWARKAKELLSGL